MVAHRFSLLQNVLSEVDLHHFLNMMQVHVSTLGIKQSQGIPHNFS